MSDQSTEGPLAGKADGEQEPAAGTSAPPFSHLPITILRQYVKDFSFENPNAPKVYEVFTESGPDLKVSVDLAANRLGKRSHEVVVGLNVTARKQDTTAFIVELTYAGIVVPKDGLSDEELEEAVMIETPRYLFPFIRATVANMVREGGFPPLLLNPIDFRQVYRQRRSKKTQDSDPGA